MRTIALRFSNNFAPPSGTISSHQEVIAQNGYVWYGKLGSAVSTKIADVILKDENPRILLIHSGFTGRYWAYVDKIQYTVPNIEAIPEYYRHLAGGIKTWFRVVCFENADKHILSYCTVVSSGALLSDASKYSMSPYFIIECKTDV